MVRDIKRAARKFTEYWLLGKESEVASYQKFWLSLLGDVLGVEDAIKRIKFEVPVPMGNTTKYIDGWISETKVLIEQKTRGIKLSAPQSGHGGKTPYEQALEYNNARGYNDKARWIITSNFDEIWVYDMAHPLAEPQKLNLGDLPREIHRLEFIVDSRIDEVRRKEERISKQAGEIVGELYDEILKRYAPAPDGTSPMPETLASLNKLCVRLVFCFYAEDAELFAKDSFWQLLKNTPAPFLRTQLLKLFRALDTPIEEREPYLESEIAIFPYTNGGLFKHIRDAEIPPLDEGIKSLLVKSANFDWRDISPTIFGALFESTLNPATRRAGGMVYTSIENIHKVIDPLFLDELKAELEKIKAERNISRRSNAALAFQQKLASLTFLDPACGSGNFLTETFLSLRELENEAIKLSERLQSDERIFDLGDTVKVKIDQFHGIEINDFAVSVAKTAMWISEAKMLEKTAELLAIEPKYLPLHDYDGIIEGNALHLDWPKTDYIMGNPPFVGARNKSAEQASDMISVFGKDWKNLGNLDYVTCWYKKACDFSSAAPRCAFVSTNSICQGDSVAALWKPLVEKFGLEIDFAHRTFRWDNESAEKAHVHCVIVGFHVGDCLARSRGGAEKRIFDGDNIINASHINGYLMAAPDIYIESRSKPLCDVPEMLFGSMPNDGGHLSNWSDEEKSALVKKYPDSENLFLKILGSDEFINSKTRWCLWLKGVPNSKLFNIPPVLEAVNKVRELRLASKRPPTRRLADTPTLFGEIRQPESGNYLLVPRVSSENRKYVPIGFLPKNVIASDANLIIPSATLYHFGVLTSSVHMAWMRAVAGRLKSDYRYSAAIVYNNFVWPELGALSALREKIAQTAQAILEARAKYQDCTFAQMYGDKMYLFPELVAAHQANDRAVLASYDLAPDTPEHEIVAHLFKLYAERTKNIRDNL